MARTSRKQQLISLPCIDQATFNTLKKQILRGKKQKAHKLSMKDIKRIAKTTHNNTYFSNNRKDTDLKTL